MYPRALDITDLDVKGNRYSTPSQHPLISSRRMLLSNILNTTNPRLNANRPRDLPMRMSMTIAPFFPPSHGSSDPNACRLPPTPQRKHIRTAMSPRDIWQLDHDGPHGMPHTRPLVEAWVLGLATSRTQATAELELQHIPPVATSDPIKPCSRPRPSRKCASSIRDEDWSWEHDGDAYYQDLLR
ncbi:hypothetical protein EVG20_g10557 [Dentipellis fragilis]|uniref:Uncharacterized protein n=1 Tax=Dentipellis fragilis TaxID=205917 RepID=A0A4Y9XRM4_9AGAM|nr:hypothetical protein EVG20_g10557 [Dentipellis fragilis]